MNSFLRDGIGTTISAFVATTFYGGPLMLAMFYSGPIGALPVVDVGGERVGAVEHNVTLLPQPEIVAEVPELEVVDAPVTPVQAVVVAVASAADVEGVLVQASPASDSAQVAGQGTEGSGTAASSPRAGPKPPIGAAGRVAKPRKSCKDPHPNIRAGADGVMEIDRSLVDEYTRNLEAFISLGISRPYDEQGYKGWYIAGFSCLSPVHKAGFRKGDVLLSVNGKNTRSWVGVFMLYQKLKNKDLFEIALVRKGEPMTLQFRVVD